MSAADLISRPVPAEAQILPEFQKWLTVWQYCHGYLRAEAAVAAFQHHPEWKHA